MATKIFTEPSVEPITLSEAKTQLRLDSGSFADNTSSSQCIATGLHNTAASYSLKGTGIDISSAANILVLLESGTNGATGTVDVKLQDSDTDVDAQYIDVASGAFTQVTTANDNATQELAYTGTRKYLRAVATVSLAACEFGVSIVLNSPTSTEDTYLASLITAARKHCEYFLGRSLITQTWDLYLDSFPNEEYIEIPYPPLQSVTTLKYKDTAGALQTWAATNYIVDIITEPGRISLAYGISWPSTYAEIQAVQIRFVAGYGLAVSVQKHIKQAILMKLTDLYEHRGDMESSAEIDKTVEALLWADRIVPI
jgi:uncharacterized phiE125 gp8 family phage protein